MSIFKLTKEQKDQRIHGVVEFPAEHDNYPVPSDLNNG